MRTYNTTWIFLILKKKVLQDCNAIKPSEWVVRSGFSFLCLSTPLTSTVLRNWSNLAGALGYIFKGSLLGAVKYKTVPAEQQVVFLPHPSGCCTFHVAIPSSTHSSPKTHPAAQWPDKGKVCLQPLLFFTPLGNTIKRGKGTEPSAPMMSRY